MSPSSPAGLRLRFQSMEAAGQQTGYENNSVQFGSTDVGPPVLGIGQDGDDGVLGSEPAVRAGQGVIFANGSTPVELNTDATSQLTTALQAADNESGIPGYYEAQGWFAIDLFLHGLEEAGCDAGQEDLISTLQQTDDWDAGGRYPQSIPQSTVDDEPQCSYYVQLEGNSLTTLFDGEPICGETIR